MWGGGGHGEVGITEAHFLPAASAASVVPGGHRPMRTGPRPEGVSEGQRACFCSDLEGLGNTETGEWGGNWK